MNIFLYRALNIIKEQTGANINECKIAFDKTRSVKSAIQYIRCLKSR